MIDKNWTLFLDRDGIINERIIDNYVRTPEQFIFKSDFLLSIKKLRERFGKIFIVTNQQGIGKGIMSEEMLQEVHHFLTHSLLQQHILLDHIYYCPHLSSEMCHCRKPKTGMAEQAKYDFPEIDFRKSFMVGDSLSDILFGKRKEMLTVYINAIPPHVIDAETKPDFYFENLIQFTESIEKL